MNNQEIIDQVKKDIKLLEERWNSFWDHDHNTLARQRYQIENLQFELDKEKQRRNGNGSGRFSIRYVDRVVKVRGPCFKCEENEKLIKSLREDMLVLSRKLSSYSRDNDRLRSKLADLTPVIKTGDAIQVIPPVEIFDHKNRPISTLTVAREVRLAHQALHI